MNTDDREPPFERDAGVHGDRPPADASPSRSIYVPSQRRTISSPAYLRRVDMNERRKAARTRRRRDALVRQLALVVPLTAPSAADACAQAELRRHIERSIAELPKEERTVFEMHWFDGFSNAEIARQLGKPEETCRRTRQRADERFRQKLGPHYPGGLLVVLQNTPVAAAPSTRAVSRPFARLGAAAIVGFSLTTALAVVFVLAPDGTAVPVVVADTVPPVAEGGGAPSMVAPEVERATAAAPPPRLAGLSGRIQSADGAPAAQTTVRVVAFHTVLSLVEGQDLLGGLAPSSPLRILDAVTGDDGAFEITGIYPRSHLVLIAGGDRAATTIIPVTATPAAGEVLDLGPLRLEQKRRLTGEIVGPDGEPAAGVDVRILPVPAAVAELLAPAEAWRPDLRLLWRGIVSEPLPVLAELWKLVAPRTATTDAAGRFALLDVPAGPQVALCTTAGSRARANVGAQARDLGRLELVPLDMLPVQVLLPDGRPAAAAEVLFGAIPLADFGLRVLTPGPATDPGGNTAIPRLGRRMTVAARAHRGKPWTIRTDVDCDQDLAVVLLDAAAAITLEVRAPAAGTDQPGFRVAVYPGEHLAELHAIGMIPRLATDLEPLAPGRFRLDALPGHSKITLFAGAHDAAGIARIIDPTRPDPIAIEVPAASRRTIRVVDPDRKPLRNAAVMTRSTAPDWAKAHAIPPGILDLWRNWPRWEGRTDEDGRCQLADAEHVSVIFVDHPEFEPAAVAARAGTDDLEIELGALGALRGRMPSLGPGRDPPLVVAMPAFQLDGMPRQERLVPVARDGTFVLNGLPAGRWRVGFHEPIGSFDSLGSLFEYFKNDRNRATMASVVVDVPRGRTAYLQLPWTGLQAESGESARSLVGAAQIDSRPATGLEVVVLGPPESANEAQQPGWRGFLGGARVRVGDRGLFAFDNLKLYRFYDVMLIDADQRVLAHRHIDGSDARAVEFEVRLSDCTGTVLRHDGRVAARRTWRLVQFEPGAGALAAEHRVEFALATDVNGRFRISGLPHGRYAVVGGRDEVVADQIEHSQPADYQLLVR